MAESLKGKVFKVIHAIMHDGQRLAPGKLITAGEHMAEEAVEKLLTLDHPPLKAHRPGAEEEAAPAAVQARPTPKAAGPKIERVPAGEE